MATAEDEWLSLSELARRRGVTRQAVFITVRRLVGVGYGALRTRPARRGRGRLVNVADYERLTGLVVPPASELPAPVGCDHERGATLAGDHDQHVVGVRQAARQLWAAVRAAFARRRLAIHARLTRLT
jgi:hypothetical protein